MNIVNISFGITTILAALASAPVLAQTYDPGTAIIGNSTGPASMATNWSAVRVTGSGCNTPNTLAPLSHDYSHPASSAIRGFDGQLTGNQPIVARNFGPAFSGSVSIPANSLLMHPGSADECAVLRLTIPAGGAGLYAVNAQFVRADSNGDGVTGLVLRNGVRIGNAVDTARSREQVGGQATLCAGDTVDFAVHMNSDYWFDSTLLTGSVNRVGDVGPRACRGVVPSTGGVGIDPGGLTVGVLEAGEPITMTGTPNGPRSSCCGPWAGIDIIPSLQPQFPNGAGGSYTQVFTPSATLNAQMGAYLNYLHAMNPAVTTLTMSWQAANLGTGASAATSGTMIGAPQTVTWTWASGTVSMSGGGFWANAPFPLGSWIGFQTSLSINGPAAAASLLGPDCRTSWSAWRAQAQQILQPGSSGNLVFETIGARGQVVRSRAVQVAPGRAIQRNQLPRN